MARRFSKSEKVSLYLAANGACELCGCELPSNWHADHILPWSLGGETSLLNGAALCPTCNLRKSNKMSDFYLPKGLDLRKWQSEFLEDFFTQTLTRDAEHSCPNFLLVATPGAGKTVAQLTVAYNLLKLGIVDWIVICVPTDHLRNQMGRDAFQRFEIDLYHGTGFPTISEYQGEVVTYAQVASSPGIWQKRCSNRTVFLSSDEVHHLGDDLAWGESYKDAFSGAKLRLSTSGTPFRTDNQQIPWITYENSDDGILKSKADYHYGYGDGLRDGVCRHVIFPSFDASCRWLFGAQEFTATFQDELSKEDSARRRNTVIDPDESNWLPLIFQDADIRLSRIRECGHDNAAGLVVCRDKIQAALMAEMIQDLTGKSPLLVNSDISESSDLIEGFASEKGSSASRWIVAVKMVSEGVDIKRLRIAIYATNIITEMYFRQFVGRVIRVIGLDEETAYVYVYPDPTLIEFVESIKAVREHCIKDETDDSRKPKKRNSDGSGGDRQLKFFMAMEANGYESDHWFNQNRYSLVEIAALRDMALELGLPEAKLAEIARRLNVEGVIQPVAEVDPKKVASQQLPRQSKTDRKEKKRKTAHKLANKLAFGVLDLEPVEVNGFWRSSVGKSHKQSTEEELDRKIHWLRHCVAQGRLIPINEMDWEKMSNGHRSA